MYAYKHIGYENSQNALLYSNNVVLIPKSFNDFVLYFTFRFISLMSQFSSFYGQIKQTLICSQR